LQARQARYATDLAKLQADDKACKDLAGAADKFAGTIQANTAKIADCKLDLDPFLALVIETMKTPTAEELAVVKGFQDVVDAREILYNRHSLTTYTDCAAQFSQYQDYTKAKKATIAADIEHRNLRGLTKETYEEIKQQFAQFDKNKSGDLDKREFRSCLYSLGEERGKKEIDSIMAKFGVKKGNEIKILYDGFKEFMIEQLGDTDTQEEVVKGFRLMNRQEGSCQWHIMTNIMETHHMDYIKGTHGTDYAGWTASVFAR